MLCPVALMQQTTVIYNPFSALVKAPTCFRQLVLIPYEILDLLGKLIHRYYIAFMKNLIGFDNIFVSGYKSSICCLLTTWAQAVGITSGCL